MLEDKYNSQLEELNDGTVVLKNKPKTSDESKKSLQEKIIERLSVEIDGAYNAIELLALNDQLIEAKK
jgi:hypothetical protein